MNEPTNSNKSNDDFESFVQEQWFKWSPILMLGNHTLSLKPIVDPSDDDYLSVCLRYPYLDQRIQYAPSAVKKFRENPNEFVCDLVHEFCHFLTDPLYVKATQRCVSHNEIESERERLTDHIQRIVTQLYLRNAKEVNECESETNG